MACGWSPISRRQMVLTRRVCGGEVMMMTTSPFSRRRAAAVTETSSTVFRIGVGNTRIASAGTPSFSSTRRLYSLSWVYGTPSRTYASLALRSYPAVIQISGAQP